MVLTVFAGIAGFERALIAERPEPSTSPYRRCTGHLPYSPRKVRFPVPDRVYDGTVSFAQNVQKHSGAPSYVDNNYLTPLKKV